MTQYIDKSSVIAKIRSLQDSTVDEEGNFYTTKTQAEYTILCMLENFLDTLEVKEVKEEPVSDDLEAEFVLYLKRKFNIPQEGNTLKTNGWSPSPYDLLDIAKHFAQWQKKQEVKEVDLEKEVHSAADQYDINNNGCIYWEDIVGFAKHFYELGIKRRKESKL